MKRLILSLAVLFSLFFLAESAMAQYEFGVHQPCGDQNNTNEWKGPRVGQIVIDDCTYIYEYYFRDHPRWGMEFSITFWYSVGKDCDIDNKELWNLMFRNLLAYDPDIVLLTNQKNKPWVKPENSSLVLSSTAQCFHRIRFDEPIEIKRPIGDPSALGKKAAQTLETNYVIDLATRIWWPCTEVCCHALNFVSWDEEGQLSSVHPDGPVGTHEYIKCPDCIGACDWMIMEPQNKVSMSDFNNDNFPVKIIPNPSNGKFNLIFNSETKGMVTLTIRNAIGNVLFKVDVQKSNSRFEKEITIENAASGSYFYSIDIDGIPNSSGTVVIIK